MGLHWTLFTALSLHCFMLLKPSDRWKTHDTSILSQAFYVLWHLNAFIKFLTCSWCVPNCLDHLFFASFAPLPFVVSVCICPCAMKQLKALWTVAMTALFISFMPWTDDPSVLVAASDLLLGPHHHFSFFFFLFALVNLFQESLTECTGFYLPTSTSPFVGSGRGSFPLIQLFASSRYALFQLLTPPYYLALLWYALVSPRI